MNTSVSINCPLGQEQTLQSTDLHIELVGCQFSFFMHQPILPRLVICTEALESVSQGTHSLNLLVNCLVEVIPLSQRGGGAWLDPFPKLLQDHLQPCFCFLLCHRSAALHLMLRIHVTCKTWLSQMHHRM